MVMLVLSLRALLRKESWMFCAGLSIADLLVVAYPSPSTEKSCCGGRTPTQVRYGGSRGFSMLGAGEVRAPSRAFPHRQSFENNLRTSPFPSNDTDTGLTAAATKWQHRWVRIIGSRHTLV